VEDEEVILIKPYKESTTIFKMTETSFIYEEIKNLKQYMKFIHLLMKMRLFKPSSYYQSLHLRRE